jgi:hypothetical protein
LTYDISGITSGTTSDTTAHIATDTSDNGVLTSLHVGENGIPEKEMRKIMAIAMRMESMKILCGVPFKDKTLTELDISGNNLGTEGALVVAEYLDGNRALTSLNLSSNNLEAEGAKIVTEALQVTNYVIAVILAPFPCRSDHWLNYCCLLIFTGYEGTIGVVFER